MDYKGYKRGDVECGRVPTQAEWDSDDFNDYHLPQPWKFDVGAEGHVRAWLPHRCDEWVIGGRAEIEALIIDLEAALRRVIDSE